MERIEKDDHIPKRTFIDDAIIRFGDRLKQAMNLESNYSLAKRTGLSERIIRQYVNGKSYPSVDNLVRLSIATNRSISWLATGKEQDNSSVPDARHNDNYVTIHDLNIKVAAGGGTIAMSEKVGEFVFSKHWLQKEGLSNANLALFHVQGDSMETTIHDGDIALVNVNEAGWTGALNGIFILLVDDLLVIKRIEFDLIKKGIHVISDNPTYRPYFLRLDEEHTAIKVLAKVERILTRPKN